MKHKSISFLLPAVLTTGAVLLASCDKQETAAPPPPAPVTTVPVIAEQAADPAPAAVADPAPDTAVAPETATPALAGDEAIAAFKAEIAAIKKFMQDNEGSEDAAKAMEDLKELVRRAATVKTEGLPEDLASAYQRMTKVMSDIRDALDTLPVPPDQVADYMERESARSPEAAREVTAKMQEFQVSMSKLQKESVTAGAELKEIGAKYGIEGLELGD